jgi:phospho-N-acetylmuramoyl-pentapeptide-transferase
MPSLITEESVFKVLLWSIAAFTVAMAWTPLLTRYLYRHAMWRKRVREKTPDGYRPVEFQKLHGEHEVRVPRLGGLLIWVTTAILAAISWMLKEITDLPSLERLNFVSRNQTWLLLFTLIAASLLGLADDLLQIYGRGRYAGGGMRFSRRLGVIIAIAIVGAWWFSEKLEVSSIHLPGNGDWELGWFFPIFFVITMLAVFSGSVIDGIDGLAGGVFATIFGAYGIIAFFQEQYDIAAFCGAIVGSTLAFLWFNVPPARFYMSETGVLGLTTTLTVVAFLTNAVAVLPIIGFVLAMESASVILQFLSKRFRHGKKLFRVAPIHHHFEAIGWPPEKVTMRFWVISAVCAILGVVIQLLG